MYITWSNQPAKMKIILHWDVCSLNVCWIYCDEYIILNSICSLISLKTKLIIRHLIYLLFKCIYKESLLAPDLPTKLSSIDPPVKLEQPGYDTW